MHPPDLELLRSGDSLEWDYAMEWLWPSAFMIVKGKLGRFFPSDVEDVAMEALEAAVGKLDEIGHILELKLLTIALARNKAIDFLRRSLAHKRGKGMVKSFEQLQENSPEDLEVNKLMATLVPLDTGELVRLLEDFMAELRSQEMAVLKGFYVSGLTYFEVAEKSGVPVGGIGVLLQRALKKLRKIIAKNPKIMKELKEYLR